MMRNLERLREHGRLPPFANAQNRALDQLIKQKEARLAKINSEIHDYSSRAEVMQQHAKTIQQEIAQTQALCDAKQRDIEQEDHLKQLAEREMGRLQVDTQAATAETNASNEQLKALQTHLYNTSERIDAIRRQMKFSKQELEDWAKVQAEKEEDTLALLQYTKEDEKMIRELTQKMELLQTGVLRRKERLEKEITESQVGQAEVEKATEDFKRLHLERQDLILKWEAALDDARLRDLDIGEQQQVFEQLKKELADRQSAIDEKNKQLEDQENLNNEAELKTQLADKFLSSLRMQSKKAQEDLLVFQDEVDVTRNTLGKAASDLQNVRNQIQSLRGDEQTARAKLEREIQNRQETKDRLKALAEDTMSLEQKMEEYQRQLRALTLKDKELTRALKTTKEQEFKESQQAHTLATENKHLTIELKGARVAIKNLQAKLLRLEDESIKQQELVYHQDFAIQQLERKVRFAQGERSDEEKQQLKAQIELLQQDLEASQKKWELINAQYKRSLEELKHAKRRMDALEKTKKDVLNVIGELHLYNESASNQLALKIKEKEELMVDENILRLEIRRLRGFLHARADEVMTLEARQISLQLALEERNKEIEIHRDLLRIQMKTAEQERSSAVNEFRQRATRIDRLKRRYEITMATIKSEDGEEHSQAYYVIKAAQRKEELQREGDQLDAKIRQSEKEISALQNTLTMMNGRNESFRHDLQIMELDERDVQYRDMLSGQVTSAIEQYKMKKAQIKDYQVELQEIESILQDLNVEQTDKITIVQELEKQIHAIAAELEEQALKRDRALKQMATVAKKHRKAKGLALDQEAEEEVDINLRGQKEFNQAIVSKLSDMVTRMPDLAVNLNGALQAIGQPMTAHATASRLYNAPKARQGSTSVAGGLTSGPSSRVVSRASVSDSTTAKITVKRVSMNYVTSPTANAPASPGTSRTGSRGQIPTKLDMTPRTFNASKELLKSASPSTAVSRPGSGQLQSSRHSSNAPRKASIETGAQ